MLVLLRVPEELAEEARTKVVGAITKARAPTVTLFPQERRAIKSLQKYEHIKDTHRKICNAVSYQNLPIHSWSLVSEKH